MVDVLIKQEQTLRFQTELAQGGRDQLQYLKGVADSLQHTCSVSISFQYKTKLQTGQNFI